MHVHYAVLLTFVGPRPEGMECCHEDGSRKNNNLSNLRYDTPKGNWEDRRKHGRAREGVNHPCSKLTEDQVREIRKRYENGETMEEITKDYPVWFYSIRRVIRGLSYKNVI